MYKSLCRFIQSNVFRCRDSREYFKAVTQLLYILLDNTQRDVLAPEHGTTVMILGRSTV